MSQRLFIGVALPEPLRKQLAGAVESVRAAGLPKGVRVLHEDTWHVTLQFLGSVDDGLVPRLCTACEQAFAEQASFEMQLGSAGAFPSEKRARTLWYGVARGNAELAQLAAAAQRATAPLGFAPEERAFQAHVTWARAKPEADARKLIEVFAQRPSPASAGVHEAVLFRSHLSSEGARYDAVARFPLAGHLTGAASSR